MFRDGECKFLGDVSEFYVQLGLFRVEFRGNGTDWK